MASLLMFSLMASACSLETIFAFQVPPPVRDCSRSRLWVTSGPATSGAGPEYKLLQELDVLSVFTGKSMPIASTFDSSGSKKTVVAFFTHWGDFNSFEYAEKLLHFLPRFEASKVEVVGVGIGTIQGGQEFARLTGFPIARLYADETAASHRALGYYAGFGSELPINPYLKLLPMLMGIGSPGTIQAVLRGYVGDSQADASWTGDYLGDKLPVEKSTFDVLGKQGARPFEVATVRLQNMMDILPNWSVLAPPDKELITQQGGTLAFEGKRLLRRWEDKGILVYSDIKEVMDTVGVR